MGYFKLIFLPLLVIGIELISSSYAQLRIIGGDSTTIPQLPYLINLRKNNIPVCGGALITYQHVVTAAHCVDRISKTIITIHAGASRISDKSVSRTVAKVFIPENYSYATLSSDVAVLKLTTPMPTNNINIRPINLTTQPVKYGMKIKVSGWGQVDEEGDPFSDIVRTITVPVKNSLMCRIRYWGIRALTKTMFCAGDDGKDSCDGDSGSPAVCPNGDLCGVVSWGSGCGRKEYPGVYTAITAVRQFITDAIKQ